MWNRVFNHTTSLGQLVCPSRRMLHDVGSFRTKMQKQLKQIVRTIIVHTSGTCLENMFKHIFKLWSYIQKNTKNPTSPKTQKFNSKSTNFPKKQTVNSSFYFVICQTSIIYILYIYIVSFDHFIYFVYFVFLYIYTYCIRVGLLHVYVCVIILKKYYKRVYEGAPCRV